MNSHLLDLDRFLLILFAALLLRLAWQLYAPRLRRRWKNVKARLPRRWKPRSPKDCPHCCQGLSLESRPLQREVEPYPERKSTRGRKKEIPTAGFACLNPLCDFFGITDDQVHALVGNGNRGIKHDIQHFRCQWCRTDFSCRRNTPLYYLKTASDRIEMVLWLMAEGVDTSVMVRYTGHADSTITRWLQRMGNHGRAGYLTHPPPKSPDKRIADRPECGYSSTLNSSPVREVVTCWFSRFQSCIWSLLP